LAADIADKAGFVVDIGLDVALEPQAHSAKPMLLPD
jgi:hypothetical protein